MFLLSLTAILTFGFASCTAYAAVSLAEKKTNNTLEVSFYSMNGQKSYSFNNNYEYGLVLDYSLTCGEGKLTATLKQNQKTQELSFSEKSTSLSDWGKGEIEIILAAERAKEAKISFSWHN